MTTNHAEPEALVHPSVVATALDVSVRTVHRMADAGDISYYKVGGQRRFKLSEVMAMLRVEASVTPGRR